MIGLGILILKDSSHTQEFEDFVLQVYHPLTENNFPGMRWTVMKCDRGENKGQYLLLGSFESAAKRDHYFPVEGEGLAEEIQKQWMTLGGDTIRDKLLEFADAEWVGDYELVKR
jgi:hypothetical protein